MLYRRPLRFHITGLLALAVLLAGVPCVWLPVAVDAKRLMPAGNDVRYYDIYLNDNRVCRACAAYWSGPDQVILVNRAGHSVSVRGMDILGADTQPIKRRFLEAVLKNTDLPGRVIVPQWYDPLQDWRDSYRQSPPPSPVNVPEGGESF